MKIKRICILLISVFAAFISSFSAECGKYVVKIHNNSRASSEILRLGSEVNPITSHSIQVNSNNLIYNGKNVIPVMGEFHFCRVRESQWRKELQKMKSGGVNIVSTYVFWIYHEEKKGEYDWSGQRDLRKFIEVCDELDMHVVLRLGPWAHGEVRNGGFPDWLVKSGVRLREDNPEYLELVKRWYSQIYHRVEGKMWKDGGPIICVQIENEYRGRGTHLMNLKKMAQEIGFDVPLFTRTGWPQLATPVPYGEILPLYGDYADGFWDRSVDEMPGDYGKSYVFRSFRSSTVIATEQLPKQNDKNNAGDEAYPYFTCELGGGMMTSYHRRINISPMDVYSMTLVRLGSGSNLPGYYMYHGGNNPDGKLTTLNENQQTNLTNYNDMPVKSYDFQAPIGEFGQLNPHYHLLRRLHLFLADFGGELALMKSYFPGNAAENFKRDSLLRWNVRSNGNCGYVFVNNYQRLKTLSLKKDVQFELELPGEKLMIPQRPINIPLEASFFIPFNMSLNCATLIYATAQPITKLNHQDKTYYFFSKIQGIPAEFVFDSNEISIQSSSLKSSVENGRIYFRSPMEGLNTIYLKNANDGKIVIVLVDEKASLQLYKDKFAGEERIFISNSALRCDRDKLELDEADRNVNFSMFPDVKSFVSNGKTIKVSKKSLFTDYKIRMEKKEAVRMKIEKIKEIDLPPRTINIGLRNVAEMPNDSDFAKAAVWDITLPDNLDLKRDILLRVSYVGDVARMYSNGKLLSDNFYNGKTFDINLNYFENEIKDNKLRLMILPLQRNMPVYFPAMALPDFKRSESYLKEPKVEVVETNTVKIMTN